MLFEQTLGVASAISTLKLAQFIWSFFLFCRRQHLRKKMVSDYWLFGHNLHRINIRLVCVLALSRWIICDNFFCVVNNLFFDPLLFLVNDVIWFNLICAYVIFIRYILYFWGFGILWWCIVLWGCGLISRPVIQELTYTYASKWRCVSGLGLWVGSQGATLSMGGFVQSLPIHIWFV